MVRCSIGAGRALFAATVCLATLSLLLVVYSSTEKGGGAVEPRCVAIARGLKPLDA